MSGISKIIEDFPPLISIIIPTYNRENILKKTLNSLVTQTYSQSKYEVIIIDDGSTDGTEEMVKSIITSAPCILKYFKQEKKGPAAARNLGIRNAQGEIILFTGDDIIADKELLKKHMEAHEKYKENVAILGYTVWHFDLKITPFMKYLEESGVQFGYTQIKHWENVPYRHFYTSNISLPKRAILEIETFDEDFPYAGVEDIEFGYRLAKKGYKIKYNPKAKGYHYHPTTLKAYCRRERHRGYSIVIFQKKHPEWKTPISLQKLNWTIIKKLPIFILSIVLIPPFCLFRLKVSLYRCYGEVLRRYFLLGIKEQLINYKWKEISNWYP